MDRSGGPAISRRAFLRAVLSGATLSIVAALAPIPHGPARIAWGAPLSSSPRDQETTQIEVIGPRSPFQPFEFVATEPGGFPILGSEIMADADIRIDVTFTVEWRSDTSGESYCGMQIIAGPDQNSPQRPGLILNVRKSDNLLTLGHRHGGRVDAVGLGTAPAGMLACSLAIAADGTGVRVTTPNGVRDITLSESLYVLGRSLRVYTSAGYATERLDQLSIVKFGPPFPVDPLPAGGTLRDAASARGISIGAIVQMWRSSYDARYEALCRGVFNHLTVEGGLSWKFMRPARDRFFFGWADAESNFAAVNGLGAHAQHLIWHSSFGRNLPDWLTGGAFSRDEMIAIMREHISTVMEHYRGTFARWVVVNEAQSPNGFWPNDPWYRSIGQDYLQLAFRAAREADPNVELIYNETNAIGNKKADQVYSLVKELKEQGLIDGVGMQMHFRIPDAVGPSWQVVAPGRDQLLAEMARYRDIGVSVEVTELDVNVYGAPISQEEKLQRQAQVFADVLGAALASGVCRRLTMHGFVDPFSWLLADDDVKGMSEAPCIFDDEYRPKPAYFALRDLLAQA